MGAIKIIKMKRGKFLLLTIIITVFTSCDEEESVVVTEPTDKLEEFGILGKWGLQARTMSGITNMIPLYDTLDFAADNEISDFRGEFQRSGLGQTEVNGQFIIDTANNKIHFDFNNIRVSSYKIIISEDLMTFDYVEDSVQIVEDWIKEE